MEFNLVEIHMPEDIIRRSSWKSRIRNHVFALLLASQPLTNILVRLMALVIILSSLTPAAGCYSASLRVDPTDMPVILRPDSELSQAQKDFVLASAQSAFYDALRLMKNPPVKSASENQPIKTKPAPLTDHQPNRISDSAPGLNDSPAEYMPVSPWKHIPSWWLLQIIKLKAEQDLLDSRPRFLSNGIQSANGKLSIDWPVRTLPIGYYRMYVFSRDMIREQNALERLKSLRMCGGCSHYSPLSTADKFNGLLPMRVRIRLVN